MSRSWFRSSATIFSAILTALTILTIVPMSVAAATPAHGRITKGAVTSAFQARTTGGYLNLLRGRTVAAPVRGIQDGRISFFSDRTYCSADWHYLGVTLLGEGGRQAAGTYLAATNVTFAIDGVPVSPTMRTAIKPFVGTGIHGQFGISVGALIPPGSIADGPHSLETQITTPDFGVEVLDVTFTLAPDACG
ncbi:MAG TPA: hypothetical protein VNM34_15615 [Verrucomicrobiae bacterium]|nr:hypothetical protein [Verrucomicrobiae bacterium]